MPFFSPDRPSKQKVSEVCLEREKREDLPVQLSTFWPVLSSVGVHQNPETSSSCSQGERCKANSLHRRYTDTGAVQGLDPRPGDRNVVPAGMPGIHCEQEEINPEPDPGNRILGPISGLHSNGAKTSSNKDEAYSSGSSQATVQI